MSDLIYNHLFPNRNPQVSRHSQASFWAKQPHRTPWAEQCIDYIDIESLQNRLLKVCYVPATSASLPRVTFFFSFLFLLLRPLTVLMKQTR